MGKILKQLEEMAPKIRWLFENVDSVDTSRLRSNLYDFVFKTFECLKPLRYKWTKIGVFTFPNDYTGRTEKREVAVGAWINLIDAWRKYGWPISSGEVFFQFISMHGDKLVEHLRRPIKGDFLSLVECTRRLENYDPIIIKRELKRKTGTYAYHFPWHSRGEKSFELQEFTLDTLIYKTDLPYEFGIISEDFVGNYFPYGSSGILRLSDESNIALLEDVIDDCIDMVKEAQKRVQAVREHNKPILNAMKEIVSVWKISKVVKGI